MMIRNLSLFSNPLRISWLLKAQVNLQELLFPAQTTTPPNTSNHSSNASTDSQRKQRLPLISWFKCCPNWLVFLHISRAPSPLLGGLPISLYLLIIDSACKLGTKTSKQSQRSLCRLEGAASGIGVNVKLHLNLTRRSPFLGIYVRLFKAAARSSATTTGFTVVHHWGFLYIEWVTVTMQLEGILKEVLCRINYCINV